MTPLQQQVINFIKQVEGCKLKAYLDGKNIPTIGYGTTKYPNGNLVKLGDICTQEQADGYLEFHLEKNVYPKLFNFKIQNEGLYIAVCSLVYNVGRLGLVMQNALTKEDLKLIVNAFRMYNKINIDGKLVICQGLVNRREEEIKLFLKEK